MSTDDDTPVVLSEKKPRQLARPRAEPTPQMTMGARLMNSIGSRQIPAGPRSGARNSIDLSRFSEEQQSKLAVFDTDGDGQLDASELVNAANMYDKKRKQKKTAMVSCATYDQVQSRRASLAAMLTCIILDAAAWAGHDGSSRDPSGRL